jgi:head-tail adaptor
MPGIGQLRHRITVENPTRAADGDGGFTESWAAASPSPVWGRIEPATPSKVERMAGNTIEGPISHLVTLRAHDGITLKTRLTFDSRRLHVRGLQRVDEVDHWLVLACEEFV